MIGTSDATALLIPASEVAEQGSDEAPMEHRMRSAASMSSAAEDRAPIHTRRLATFVSQPAAPRPSHARAALEREGPRYVQPQVAIKILGERFILEPAEEGVIIRHPRWSLFGQGGTVLEAEADLLQEAVDLVPVYLDVPLSTLDVDAIALRDFIIRSLP